MARPGRLNSSNQLLQYVTVQKINESFLTNGLILERVILFLEIETYGTKNQITKTIFEP